MSGLKLETGNWRVGVMVAWAIAGSVACAADREADALRNVMANLRVLVEQASGATVRAAAPVLGAELEEQAPELLERGVIRDVAAAPRWRAWRETLMTLDAAGRRTACRTAATTYGALRRAFQGAQSSNNVRTMCVLVFEAEFVYRQIQSLMDEGGANNAPLPIAAPADLRASYSAAVHAVRKDWMTALRPDRGQATAIEAIVKADTIAAMAATVEAARTNVRSAVSLAWLGKVCQSLTLQEPLNFSYWYGAATCARLLGTMEAENEIWRQALALFPDSAYAHFRLACSCGQGSRQATRSIVHLRWLASRVRDEVWQIRIQNEFARRHGQRGNFDVAATCIADALKRASRKFTPTTVQLYAEARRIESDLFLRQGKPNDALRSLEDAATAAPDDVTILLTAAHTLFGLAMGGTTVDISRVEAALTWYDKVLRVQPRCAAVHARKAYLHMLLSRWDLAQAEAVTELTIDPCSVSALTVLGLCYLAEGDAANALVFFNKALDMDSSCLAAHDGRALAKAAIATATPKPAGTN